MAYKNREFLYLLSEFSKARGMSLISTCFFVESVSEAKTYYESINLNFLKKVSVDFDDLGYEKGKDYEILKEPTKLVFRLNNRDSTTDFVIIHNVDYPDNPLPLPEFSPHLNLFPEIFLIKKVKDYEKIEIDVVPGLVSVKKVSTITLAIDTGFDIQIE
jgi:hypothetical protein